MIHRYFYVEADHLVTKRGCNKAVEVFKLVPGDYPVFIGADYEMNSASWAGYKVRARQIVAEKTGHKLPDPYKDFPAKNVTLESIYGG